MKVYLELLEEIKSANSQLDKLTGQAAALEPIRESRRRIPNFDNDRRHAVSVHATLQRSLTGTCKTHHRASLYVKPLEDRRISEAKDALSLESERNSLRVVLQHDQLMNPISQVPWSIRETEIRLMDADRDAGVASSSRSVQFQIPGPPATIMDIKNLTEIQDLCQSLHNLRAQACGQCLGYLQDVSLSSWHCFYVPQTPLFADGSITAAPLRSLLSSATAGSLKEADKRRLALSLAVAMLRLHDTPWLQGHWGKDDIMLFLRDGDVVAEHPFISTCLSLEHAAAAPLYPEAYFQRSQLIQNETIFALGILLIELCLNKPFDELKLPEDMNGKFSDFFTAVRLIDQVYEAAGDRYGDVVRRCVRCEFDQRKSSLHDASFRKAVWEGVVAVLQLEVNEIHGL